MDDLGVPNSLMWFINISTCTQDARQSNMIRSITNVASTVPLITMKSKRIMSVLSLLDTCVCKTEPGIGSNQEHACLTTSQCLSFNKHWLLIPHSCRHTLNSVWNSRRQTYWLGLILKHLWPSPMHIDTHRHTHTHTHTRQIATEVSSPRYYRQTASYSNVQSRLK